MILSPLWNRYVHGRKSWLLNRDVVPILFGGTEERIQAWKKNAKILNIGQRVKSSGFERAYMNYSYCAPL